MSLGSKSFATNIFFNSWNVLVSWLVRKHRATKVLMAASEVDYFNISDGNGVFI